MTGAARRSRGDARRLQAERVRVEQTLIVPSETRRPGTERIEGLPVPDARRRDRRATFVYCFAEQRAAGSVLHGRQSKFTLALRMM